MSDPICTDCKVPRKAIWLELLNDRYQMTAYECPACNTVLRLVEHRNVLRADFGKRTSNRRVHDD
jgi:hypothetical protein